MTKLALARRRALWVALSLAATASPALAQTPPDALPPPPPLPPAAAPDAPPASPPPAPTTPPAAPPATASPRPAAPATAPATGTGATPAAAPNAAPTTAPATAPGATTTTAPSAAPATAPGATPAAAPNAAPATGPFAGPATGPAAAPSSDDVAQAALLRARGNKAFDEGHYVDALAAYEASAKRVPPDAALSFNLAHTYERLGRYADALAFYLRFQEGASAEQLARVGNLDQRLARLRGKVTVLRVNVNVPGARVRVRDVLVGVKQADRPVVASLDEGRAPVEISFEGYQPYYKDHTLLGGNVLDLDVMLSQQAGPTLVVEKTNTVYVSSTPFWSQWWFWAGAGALVVGGATAAYALSTEKDPRGGSLGTVSFGQRVRGAAFALTF